MDITTFVSGTLDQYGEENLQYFIIDNTRRISFVNDQNKNRTPFIDFEKDCIGEIADNRNDELIDERNRYSVTLTPFDNIQGMVFKVNDEIVQVLKNNPNIRFIK